MGLLKTGSRWWWVFIVCIAAPALALAVFGLRTVDLERVERRTQIEQQQGQTALLADTRIADRLLQSDREPAAGVISFTLEASGTLVFPRDRIYFAEIGSEPTQARWALPEALANLAREALAAEAQSDFARADEICRRLAADPLLGVWARLVLARMQLRAHPEHFLEWTRSLDARYLDARSPDGEPVMLTGAGLVGELSGSDVAACRPFLSAALNALRGGQWWLRWQERRVHDDDLRAALAAGNAMPARDPLLAQAAAIERVVRRTAPFSREGQVHLYAREGPDAYLLVTDALPGAMGGWNGVALSGKPLSGFLQECLGVIWKSAPYAASLADSSGRVLWGDRASSARRSFPLRSVSGWELRLGEANTGDQGRRFLWYAFVLLLLMMLAFGVAVTLRTARREMELGRLQAEFAAGVTHEFKSPITGIRLLMERIIGGRVNSRSTIQDYYTAVCRETDRLELLVNRLLETHRIQSGQARYHFAPHCMADIAESAISRLRAQADAKRIHLTLETDDAQREADLDCTAIQDSLENLIENAIKYSPPDTSVAVTVEHTAKEVRVTVRDQGAGIDPADLPRIFDRFYRGRRDERQSVRGTGLGLPLVKAVVEGHGGLVEVKSIPGKGSEFCLRIPLREEERYAQSAHRG